MAWYLPLLQWVRRRPFANPPSWKKIFVLRSIYVFFCFLKRNLISIYFVFEILNSRNYDFKFLSHPVRQSLEVRSELFSKAAGNQEIILFRVKKHILFDKKKWSFFFALNFADIVIFAMTFVISVKWPFWTKMSPKCTRFYRPLYLSKNSGDSVKMIARG